LRLSTSIPFDALTMMVSGEIWSIVSLSTERSAWDGTTKSSSFLPLTASTSEPVKESRPESCIPGR